MSRLGKTGIIHPVFIGPSQHSQPEFRLSPQLVLNKFTGHLMFDRLIFCGGGQGMGGGGGGCSLRATPSMNHKDLGAHEN